VIFQFRVKKSNKDLNLPHYVLSQIKITQLQNPFKNTYFVMILILVRFTSLSKEGRAMYGNEDFF